MQIDTSLSQEADKDDSGTVDFFEFVNLMVKRENEKETEDDLKQVFRVFDKVQSLPITHPRDTHIDIKCRSRYLNAH